MVPTRVVLVMLASGLTACDGSRPSAVIAPTPAAPGVSSMTRVEGYVRDMGSRPLESVTVEVLDGPQTRASATTDASGAFSFTGMFDDTVRFRATKVGHIAAVKTSEAPPCAGCPRHLDFVLDTSGSAVEIAGDYALTFVVDSACAGMPPEVRQRTYLATAVLDRTTGSQFKMTVLDSSVLHDYEWEGLFIQGTENYFVMGVGNFHGSPGLVERVAPDAYVSFDGGAEGMAGTPDAPAMSTAFDGVIEYCQLPAGSPPPVAEGRYSCSLGKAVARVQCTSRHRFMLTRR